MAGFWIDGGRTTGRIGMLGLAVGLVVQGCGAGGEVATVAASATDAEAVSDLGGGPDDSGGTTDQQDGGPAKGCVTKNDCKDMLGQTPCRVPACHKGTCELVDHPQFTPCVDEFIPVNECQQLLCDGKGECKANPRPKTAGCTDANITASECQLKRCDGAGKCALVDIEDGTGCAGSANCGKVCKGGKCSAQTSADWDDGNPCTKDYCDQGLEVKHDIIDDLTVQCEDGDKCTGDDVCKKGQCGGVKKTCNDGHPCTADSCDPTNGCAHEPDDAKCPDDGNPCTVLGCDAKEGCVPKSFNKGAKCSDNEECTVGDACGDKGGCVGGESQCTCESATDCDQSNLCQPLECVAKKCVVDPAKVVKCDAGLNSACGVNACNPKTGTCALVAKNEGQSCDDSDVCTAKSSCIKGVCAGPATLSCDDKDPCTEDYCDALKGCLTKPAEGACDDGNACTTNDTCSGGSCHGEAKPCEDGVPCTLDGCDAKTGKCTATPNDKSCEDNNPCTTNRCGAKGCEFPTDDAATCDDGNKCTKDDKCATGACSGTYDKGIAGCGCAKDTDCDDNKACTADKCAAGDCKFDAASKDGASCDDGSKCNVAGSGKCQSGACTAGTPKDCSKQATACETAFCDAKTGACVTQKKTDGTTCQDGSGCTENDRCVGGKCEPGKAVVCADKSGCVAAECKSKTATTHECAARNKPSGELCNDGKYCTEGEKCDGAGKCAGGKARDCSTAGDACNEGVCDDAKKACVKKPKPTGVTCSDGDYCTVTDKCDGKGACAGTGKRSCPNNAAKCLAGQCNSSQGKCLLVKAADNTACNDDNACTQTDKCAGGVCKGGNPKTCKAGGACLLSVCESASGQCAQEAKSDGSPCSDGNACTAEDRCLAGVCRGENTCACTEATQAKDCNDQNPCTKDLCYGSGSKLHCVNDPLAGMHCDDGNPCTGDDVCSAKGGCAGVKRSCDDKNPCTTDYCKAGKCYNGANGNTCTDGNACTVGDKCSAGKCVSGSAVNCNDGTKCSTDSCNKSTGRCSHLPANDGAACESSYSQCTSARCLCKFYYRSLGGSTTSEILYGVTPAAYRGAGSLAVGQYKSGSYYRGLAVFRDSAGNPGPNIYVGASDTRAKLLYRVARYGSGYYSTGYRYSGTNWDGWFVQFDAGGKVLRHRTLAYSTSDDVLYGVAVQSSSVVWGVGYTRTGGGRRGWLTKISPSGKLPMVLNRLWGSTKFHSYFRGIAYYGSLLYVAGYTNYYGNYDALVLTYDTNGNYKAASHFGTTSADYIYDIVPYGSYLWLAGQSYNATTKRSDGWVTRLYRTTLKQVAGVDKRYGNYGSNAYYSLTNWGSGVAAVGYEPASATNKNGRLRVDFIDYYGYLKGASRYGSSSYRGAAYGVAYTGAAGGRGFAVVGYSSDKGNQAVHAQVSETGKSYCKSATFNF